MIRKYKNWLIYFFIITFIYNIFPYVAKLTDDKGLYVLSILFINPLSCLVLSIIFTIKNKINTLFNLLLVLLFIIPINIFYNSSANSYILIYFVSSLCGNLIGYLIKNRNHR